MGVFLRVWKFVMQMSKGSIFVPSAEHEAQCESAQRQAGPSVGILPTQFKNRRFVSVCWHCRILFATNWSAFKIASREAQSPWTGRKEKPMMQSAFRSNCRQISMSGWCKVGQGEHGAMKWALGDCLPPGFLRFCLATTLWLSSGNKWRSNFESSFSYVLHLFTIPFLMDGWRQQKVGGKKKFF